MNTDKMFRVYIRQSDAPEDLTPVCRKVYIPREIIPIVNAHLFWLTRQWAWGGTENVRQQVVTAVASLMEALAYSECTLLPNGGGKEDVNGGVGVGIGVGCDDCDDCEEREEIMSCIKRVRIFQGKLQVSYFDEHSCADCWEDVGDYILEDIDVNVGDILLDSENRAREGRKIRVRPPVVNINEEEIARCAKATAIVDAALAAFDAIIGVKNGWIDTITSIIPIDDVWEIIKPFLPVEIQALFEIGEFIAVSLGVSEDELAALNTFMEGAVREEIICQYVKVIKNSEEVVGEDLTNLAVILTKLDFQAVEVFYRVVRTWDVFAFKDIVSKQEESADCGCPRISDPGSLSEPEEYDWCYTFDFTQDAFSTFWAVTTENGNAGAVWTEGVGYEDKIAAFQKTLSLHINNLTAQFVGADFLFRNEARGLLKEPQGSTGNLQMYAGIGDAVNAITQFFFGGTQISNRAERKIQWRGFMNAQDKVLTLRAILAYDGVDFQNIPPNDAGNLVLRSIKMWGKGTNPFGTDNC